MPNFIVPVVGNPAGGFQNGDQVTAENLNAHVQDAVPTADFIVGRQTTTDVFFNDWFLKVGPDGNLYKVRGGLVGSKPELIQVSNIRSATGDGSGTIFGSVLFNQTSNFIFTLNAYSDTSERNGGNFIGNANGYAFNYNAPIASGWSNLFTIGDGSKLSTFVVHGDTIRFNSPTRPVNFNSTNAIKLPSGTSSERPSTDPEFSSINGFLRFNTENQDLEFASSAGWNSVKGSAGGIVYIKKIPDFTFNWDLTFYETPSVVVPEGEIWVYELHYVFNADNWGGNTRPEMVFQTALFFNSIEKLRMSHFTGAYGGPISPAIATLTLTRADTHVNGTDFPVKIVWKNVPGGSRRFGSYGSPHAWGFIKLTRIKTASQGSGTYL